MAHSTQQRQPVPPRVLAGQIDHHVTDFTVTAAADISLQSLQDKLAAENQWLPIDGNPSTPLGELIEQNSTGPLRLGYGAWRDLLLGAQFENKTGEIISAGGRVMKNVAGYDLTKFMVGQQKAFGKITTLTARTYRRPTGAIRITLAPDITRITALLATALRPQWMLLDHEQLHLGYVGNARTLDFYRAKINTLEPQSITETSLDDDITFRSKMLNRNTGFQPVREPTEVNQSTTAETPTHSARAGSPCYDNAFRASVPPARILEFTSQLDNKDWIADPVFGFIRGVTENKESVRAAAKSAGGSVQFAGDSPLASYSGSELNLLARLQNAFGASATIK